MAATCDKHASNVEAAATTPPAMGATMQATVAAVGAFHAVTTMTGTVLGARLVGTSVAAEYAAAAFDATEAANQADLGWIS